ncbi:hypothetical protein K505DRAFT_256214, partial [Melanomma pulvis-pyrius CBS 109.77]
FNSTNILPDSPFLKSRTVQNRDILQDIQSKINSVKDAATTGLPGAVATPIQVIQSKVNSVKDAIATGLPDAIAAPIQEIEKYIPKNCSLGTKEFCVGVGHNITCKNLPLSLSDLVPDIAQNLSDVVQEKLQEKLQPLERTLTKVTTPYIQYCLVAALVLLVIIAILFACAVFSGLFSITSILARLTIGLRVVMVLGLICCVLLFIPTIILRLFQAKTKALPSGIEEEKGEVGGLCIGALCCAVVITILTAITPTVI